MSNPHASVAQRPTPAANAKGRLWAEYWIDCGACAQREELGEADRHRAIIVATERGWRWSHRQGYVCAKCAEKLEP